MDKKILNVKGLEILDSRGFPTVRAQVTLSDGTVGSASVPSGASTGMFEAFELRDQDEKKYGGKGVTKAVNNINEIISPALTKLQNPNLWAVDNLLIELDGTKDKTNLGANTILAVSLAFATAASKSFNIPLYRYLGGFSSKKMPVPMMNILNGGIHATNNIDIQEFMIIPISAPSFKEGIRWCSEIYHTLGKILKNNGFETSVGDEGGFAPNLSSDEEALEAILEAINQAGYNTEEIKLAVDAASSRWYFGNEYKMPKRQKTFTKNELIKYWANLCNKYPIFSIEDGMGEQDFEGWSMLTQKLGNKVQLIGDDLFVTNSESLRQGIREKIANSVLIKPNQVGTLTETFETIDTAKSAGYATVASHRSGETEDTSIADISVAAGCWQIKAGAPCRSERVAKYNRLLQIEDELESQETQEKFFGLNNRSIRSNSWTFNRKFFEIPSYKSKKPVALNPDYLLEV
ncbi:MAG: Enolase [Eubacteriales bacterium SKADARSKE-1]|nr:Enolase [Eubacteriales bacterium SKADARSKE-1]